jgi:hypothetical protein
MQNAANDHLNGDVPELWTNANAVLVLRQRWECTMERIKKPPLIVAVN